MLDKGTGWAFKKIFFGNLIDKISLNLLRNIVTEKPAKHQAKENGR